jgi:hypothetical protein
VQQKVVEGLQTMNNCRRFIASTNKARQLEELSFQDHESNRQVHFNVTIHLLLMVFITSLHVCLIETE